MFILLLVFTFMVFGFSGVLKMFLASISCDGLLYLGSLLNRSLTSEFDGDGDTK